ncbi:uncharacterized protein LOC126456780 isoform X1 [Schistocerca serialis cubense]|uniref:uncharacterized protein LOC126456780 isoform X1 n=1 Tax=Schistocerca serialis cubense TaxID=2023355 RepID=UPI00214E3AAC|nr:uncharacterized protein LOC126456780 isoform X1 [Schistocerca serialis cubense]
MIVMDNGPQFTSTKFKQFSAANGISLIHTAPSHPVSDRQAEHFVWTFRTQLDKLLCHRPLEEAVLLFLATYCSTPHASKSPPEILHGRPFCSPLSVLVPKTPLPPAHTPALSFQGGQEVWAQIFFHPQVHLAPAVVTKLCSLAMASLWWADGSGTSTSSAPIWWTMTPLGSWEMPVPVDGRPVMELPLLPQPLPPLPAAPALAPHPQTYGRRPAHPHSCGRLWCCALFFQGEKCRNGPLSVTRVRTTDKQGRLPTFLQELISKHRQ